MHLCIFKDAHIGQSFLDARLPVEAVAMHEVASARDAGTILNGLFAAKALVVHPAVEHVGAHQQLVVIVDGEVTILQAVVGYLSSTAQEPKRAFPFVKHLLSHGRHPFGRNKSHGHMSSTYQGGVCLVGKVVGTEIVTAHIAQQGTDAGTLAIQVEYVELLSWTD